MSPLRRTAAVLATAATLTVAAAGCSTGSGASDQSSPTNGSAPSAAQTKKIAVSVKGNDVTPDAEPVTVAVGQPVELDVTADRAGELHVHSSPEHEFPFTSGRSTFRFTLSQPGSVIVEEHVSEALVLKILVR